MNDRGPLPVAHYKRFLMPEGIELPKRVRQANAALSEAAEALEAAKAARRQAREDVRAAKRRDEPPATLRQLEDARADAEHAEREATREAEAASRSLVETLGAHRDELVAPIDYDADRHEIHDALTHLAELLDRQAQRAGFVRTVNQISDPRIQSRGFERVGLNPTGSRPEAHLAALAEHADQVREVAATQAVGQIETEAERKHREEYERNAAAWAALARGGATIPSRAA
jgi:hypothetical protein